MARGPCPASGSGRKAHNRPGAVTSSRAPCAPTYTGKVYDRKSRPRVAAKERVLKYLAPARAGTNGRAALSLGESEYTNFVEYFRGASSYIEGFRGKTFVIVIDGEVIQSEDMMSSVLSDVSVLHDMGVKIVLVLGAKAQIDSGLRSRGVAPRFEGGYRVTDDEAMAAATQAAGTTRTTVEARLSMAPSVSMVRRHARTAEEYHYRPAVRVVSGNYVAAKRRGICRGVDFGFTGEVRWVDAAGIDAQLENGNIVALSNIGHCTSGGLLNCNTLDVGTNCAISLMADKLICLRVNDSGTKLPAWLSLGDAERLVDQVIDSVDEVLSSADRGASDASSSIVLPGLERMVDVPGPACGGEAIGERGGTWKASSVIGGTTMPLREQQHIKNWLRKGLAPGDIPEKLVDLDSWCGSDLPIALMACCLACRKGVTRAHILDASLDGVLLLELFTRDGVGTMVSTDFYEGIRPAVPGDVEAIGLLLKPLEEEGITLPRTSSQLEEDIPEFLVVERESRVLACAQLCDLGQNAEGLRVSELAAFCVDREFRGMGRGDNLLDFVEQVARSASTDLLVLLTTRTAEWFMQREFLSAGAAHMSTLLPEPRRACINPSRNSQLFVKALEPAGEGLAPAGKRIGF